MNGLVVETVRNAALTIFTYSLDGKNGILAAVRFVCDHTEHDVHVIITEQGAADSGGLTSMRARKVIIKNCAHPDFRPS